MAREIDKIISSKTAPKDKNVIWDDGKTLNIYRNGKWESAVEITNGTGEYITPDWNANKGGAGYIENRTHYYKEEPISVEIISNDKAIVYNESSEFGASFFKVKTHDYDFNPTYELIDPRYNNDYVWDAEGTYNIKFSIEDNHYVITGNVDVIDLFDIRFIRPGNMYKLSDCFIPDTIARVADYEALEARVAELEAKLNEITVTVDE